MPGDVKTTLVIMALIDVAAVPAAGCGASAHETGPVIILEPDEFVLRDVRKDAAPYLNCQVPMVTVQLEPWAGSQGNVTAIGCGLHITYYVVCQTSHECTFRITD
jgi:hypothetical protein